MNLNKLVTMLKRQLKIYIPIIFFILSVSHNLLGQTITEQKNILDSFPLPQAEYQIIKTLKTANEYFESAYNRTIDFPYDSLANFYNLRDYQNAIKLDEKNWYSYRNLSDCFCIINRYDLALVSINLAFKYCPNLDDAPELYNIRGTIYYRLKDYLKAINDFQKLVDMGYSPLEDSYYKLAKATLKSGQIEKAKQIIINAKNIDFTGYDLKVFGL